MLETLLLVTSMICGVGVNVSNHQVSAYLDESFYANNKYGELFNIETRIENNVLYL